MLLQNNNNFRTHVIMLLSCHCSMASRLRAYWAKTKAKMFLKPNKNTIGKDLKELEVDVQVVRIKQNEFDTR